MPMIDSDKLKPAVAAWVAASEAFNDAAQALRVATDTARESVPALYERAQVANEAWHDRAQDLAIEVRRLIGEAEREG